MQRWLTGATTATDQQFAKMLAVTGLTRVAVTAASTGRPPDHNAVSCCKLCDVRAYRFDSAGTFVPKHPRKREG
jgi:hypothetical protein